MEACSSTWTTKLSQVTTWMKGCQKVSHLTKAVYWASGSLPARFLREKVRPVPWSVDTLPEQKLQLNFCFVSSIFNLLQYESSFWNPMPIVSTFKPHSWDLLLKVYMVSVGTATETHCSLRLTPRPANHVVSKTILMICDIPQRHYLILEPLDAKQVRKPSYNQWYQTARMRKIQSDHRIMDFTAAPTPEPLGAEVQGKPSRFVLRYHGQLGCQLPGRVTLDNYGYYYTLENFLSPE